MKATKTQLLQYSILLILGCFLLWLFFKNVNFNDLFIEIKNRKYQWFYVVLLVSLAVYVIRALRWKMLIESNNEYKISFNSVLAALSIGYFVNLAIPRLGEITRCLSLKKSTKIQFTELLGTVIIERVIDIVSLLLFLLLTLILQFNQIIEFVAANIYSPTINLIKEKLGDNKWLLLLFGVLTLLTFVLLFIYFKKWIKDNTPSWAVKFLEGLKLGLVSISNLEKKKIFVLYTILIWLGYYLMTYFWFFVFADYSILTWGTCLSIVAIGTIGRSIPIQGGGMGAYHFLVTGIIILYGGSENFGKSLAILIHGGQTFFTFLMGIIGLLMFYINYWKNK